MKYDPTTGLLCFSLALRELKRGQRVARMCWAGQQSVAFIEGALLVFLPDNERFPWFPTQADVLAEDWVQLT